MKNVAIYTRVSTKAQDPGSQVRVLTQTASRLGLTVVETIEETISGKTKMNARAGIAILEKLIERRAIDTVMVYNVSRIGRTLLEALQFIEDLNNRKINVYINDLNSATLVDGKPNPSTTLMIQMLGSIAEYQREQIVANVIAGQQRARAEGVQFGRPAGTGKTDAEILANYPRVVAQITEGRLSVREMAKINEISTTTVMKLKGMTPSQKVVA